MKTQTRYDVPAALEKTGREQGECRKAGENIVLFGLFGCGNFGNDGSLEAMIDFLRQARPKAKLSCVCADPDLIAREFAVEAYPIRGSRGRGRSGWLAFMKIPARLFEAARAFRYIRGAELMIVPGTGILDDYGERFYGVPFDIFRWCLAARITGAKIAFVSIGAGPIRHGLSRLLMISAARLAHYRSYRDLLSKEFMESAGFDTRRDAIFPDIAFKLRKPTTPIHRRNTRLTVGVGVMNYSGWYGFAAGGEGIFDCYIGKLADFVVHLLDSGHDVRLLTGEGSDCKAVAALLAKVGEARPDAGDGRIAAEPAHSLHDLMHQMSRSDVVVATRYHNLVCALKMGKPTISLGYSKKNDALMQQMGLSDYCQHVERFEVETLARQFSHLVALRKDHEREIRDKMRLFEEQLARQDAHLLSAFLS